MFFSKKKVTDPVCGMVVKVGSSTPSSIFKEKEYYFCSAACHVKFEANPEKYVANSKEDCCHHRHSGGDDQSHREHQHHGHCSNAQNHDHQCCGKHSHNHH